MVTDPETVRSILASHRLGVQVWTVYMIFYMADPNSPTGAHLHALVAHVLGTLLGVLHA